MHLPTVVGGGQMVACLCFARPQCCSLAAALPAGVAYTVATSWAEFERDAAGAECTVLWVDWLGEEADFTRMRAFRDRAAPQPSVLVTLRDADNARHLKDVFVDEVVWRHEVQRELWPAIRRARSCGVLARCAAELRRAPGLPPAMRRGLAFACRSPRPVPTVSALGVVVGCNRRTLWRHWNIAVAGRSSLALQDVLDWLLLLRAHARKSGEVSWRVVSTELGVHEHTLARVVHRLVGRTLREFVEQPVDSLLDAFRELVLAPLDGPPVAGAAARQSRGGPRDSLVPRETDGGCCAAPEVS